MNLHVLSHADTNEIGSIANNALKELAKSDWSSDVYLKTIFDRLQSETNVLTAAIGLVRKNDYTQQLIAQDALFDQAFIGTKQFVYANTYSLDRAVAEKAQKIWAIFEAHDLNLYRLGYEQQIFVTHSLLNELDKPKNKTLIESLDGVVAYLSQLKIQNEALETLFQKSKEDEAAKSASIAPSTQKNLIREILNVDLFPYIEVMSKVKPEIYAASFKVISEYVESINIKVKARKTRSENQVEAEKLS
ncbi:hypothetical protein EO244_14995 [Ancylomarina salipaludis]|uniref:Uncharacterized protein n=1 Tax=Ancylomarina salipaludis TaxID=2501299 RepID=A0A4V1MZT3_9BACT|nr:DUF6261 family protein [Ancylomarina salipaludis]RXQ88833.1 hypothetical protein EO244_14995 [Ancylomarina salipaludis]